MTDDLATRTQKLRAEMTRNSRWALELCKRADTETTSISPEAAAEARKAAGLDPTPAPPTPEQEPEPNHGPGDGGARGVLPIGSGEDGIKQRIREAEAAGDLKEAVTANSELYLLRQAEMHG